MRSGSRQHRGEAGGGWLFGFPPLLATDGRNHKGDCDMRTGAIFARGSCRALKWMALVGMVFALGSTQAAAQETLDTAVWTPEDEVVTVTMSGPVWTQGAPASDFTVTWTGPTGSPATGMNHTIAGSLGTASNMFTITLDKVIPTSAQGVTVTYTDSGAAASPINPQLQILDTDTTGYSPVAGANVGTVNEMNVNPTIPSLASFTATYQRGTLITAFNLPDATGNGVAVAPFFTYAVAGLPAGLAFTAAGPDGTAGNADDRQVAGTPTAVTAGPQTVTYLVTDRDGDSTAAPFMITVADVPATPLAPTVAATPNVGGSLDVSWGAPAPNNSPITDYEIQHRQMGAATWMNTMGTGTGTMMTFPNLTVGATYQFQVRARNAFGWSNWSGITPGVPNAAVLAVTVSAAPTTIAEGGTSTITAMANRAVLVSDGAVTVNLSVVGEAMLSASSITIAAGAQSGNVTLTSTADTDYVNDTVTVVARGTGITGDQQIAITVTDPPPAAVLAVTVSAAPTTIAEGGTSTITAMANRAVLASDGAVTVNLSVVGEATFSASSITIAAGAQSGSVTLTAAEDDADYEDETVTVTASGTGIDGNQEVEITVTDNDQRPVPAVVRGQLTEFKLVGDGVSEKTIGGVERYHVPEGSQAVDLSVTVQWTHAEIAAIGYNIAQTINVEIMSGGSDLPNWVSWIDGEGDVHFPRAGSLGNLAGGVVTVRTPRESAVPAAQHGSERHVKSVTSTLDVLILHDDHEAENDAFYIQATGGDVDLNAPKGVNAVTPEVVIEDDEDQTVTVKMGTKTSTTVYEGDSGDDVPTFTVAASPARVDLPLEVRLDMVDLGGTTVSSGEISVSTGSLTLNDGSTGNSDTVTVHLPASDGNRVDDDYELHASVNVYSVSSGGYETIPAASHPIRVLDRHKLPEVTVSPKTGTVEEGGMIELTVTINRNPSNTTVSNEEKLQYTQEEVTVMLDMGMGSTASRNDFSPVESVVFPKRERGAYTAEKTVEVMTTADNELDDMEVLVLDAMVAGAVAANGSEKDSHPAVSTLTIEEGTDKLVWAKTQNEVEAAVYAAKNAGAGDDMMFTPDEMIEVMGSALFNAAEGVTVSYSAMTSDRDVASTSVDNAGMVMVTAMGAGMADITITAHATMPSGVKILDQTDSREASIMFPVEVGLEALTLMLTGPEDMNVVEGGMGAMVTVTANRAVTEEVTVTLMRDRAMSTASDADFTAEPIVIAAGMMTGSTMVMAVEDGMMESVDNMAEELVLYGMAEGMAGEVSGQVKLYLWDAAVPALPVIAQLLLAALMAVGGYRRYRRR